MPIRNIFCRRGFLLLAFFELGFVSIAQVTSDKPVRVMFYNVENLFDIYDDSVKDDNDFLPGGLMRWNSVRYEKKIASLYKTISAAGEWEPPAVVAFCEIENRKVLEDLIFGTWLSKYKWGIVHEESPDLRGIDVCLIYRKDVAEAIVYKYWIPAEKTKGEFTSRSILYTKLAIKNDTLHLIVNHWPSRRGGVLAREDSRLEIADMVRNKVDSISKAGSESARILIVGDFNCTPDDVEIRRLAENNSNRQQLVNMSEGLSKSGSGSYRYQGTWEMIDQIIVSRSLLDCRKGLFTVTDLVKVFKPDFLLMKDPKYPGLVPFSTYRGYRYQGGFSDHLPVIVDLGVR
jgi:exonuclease III